MSKTRVVVDTSIIVDHIRNNSTNFQRLNDAYLDEKLELVIPTIVVVELFSNSSMSNRKAIKVVENSIEGIDIVDLRYESSKIAGQLIRKYKQIPDEFDLLIAAIAIEQNAQLATLNKKHFKEIKEVDLFDFNTLG